ncbi:rod shape-determining protein MreD [Virgibacillus halodenitrificans]|uniref:Rod shape-determining protein MreD n=2 Tax=Virgibacillus halodenitrificans TaxID=1482 RepID=A0AAC9IZQ2_VIRHA|nr:rod shape-determining protein MreD [Virgibacillus halodenitrificans]MYL44906.1 rod shape-determining protein MreD [Virgibacillus halodenitrificans]
MMKRLFLPFFLFLFLVSEGVALELLPPSLITGNLLIVPHWVFMFLVLIAIFYDKEDTYYSVLYGFIFGLLIDIVYTGVLGVYMFSYALVIYVIHGLKKMLHGNVFVSILLGIVGLSLADIAINVIYTVAGIASMVWKDYLLYRLLPTLLLNLVFLLFLYPIFVKRLTRWGRDQLFSNNSL